MCVCVVCFACVICNGGAGGRLAISLYCVWWGCVGVVDNIYYYYCELVSNYNYIDIDTNTCKRDGTQEILHTRWKQ